MPRLDMTGNQTPKIVLWCLPLKADTIVLVVPCLRCHFLAGQVLLFLEIDGLTLGTLPQCVRRDVCASQNKRPGTLLVRDMALTSIRGFIYLSLIGSAIVAESFQTATTHYPNGKIPVFLAARHDRLILWIVEFDIIPANGERWRLLFDILTRMDPCPERRVVRRLCRGKDARAEFRILEDPAFGIVLLGERLDRLEACAGQQHLPHPDGLVVA